MIRFLSLAVVSLFLGGCFTSTEPPIQHYVLHPSGVDGDVRVRVPASIIVEKPSVVSGLNTDRIALLKNDRRKLDYFAAARWNGELDVILQDFIIETLENSYDIVEVDATGLRQDADYVVVTKVRDFQAEYDESLGDAPNLRVSLVISVLKLPSLEPVERFIKTEEVKAEENSMQAVTQGLEMLLQNISQDVLSDIKNMIQ